MPSRMFLSATRAEQKLGLPASDKFPPAGLLPRYPTSLSVTPPFLTTPAPPRCVS